MTEIILHHYQESPFAEKIRLILGFKRMNYRSVLVPMMLPKPDVIALTGGYSMFERYSPEHRAAFIEDRKAFRKGAPRMALHAATAALTQHLDQFERQFADGRLFLLGHEATIADFSVFHPLWFIQRATAVAGFLSAWPRMMQWMHRIAEIGHGTPKPLGSADAIEIARKGETAALRTESIQAPGPCPVGARVTVAPTDYGIDPVAGTLVAEYTNEWIVKRNDARAGTVYVHFPRFNYQIATE